MKLTVFHSADGDCLLVTGRDGKTLLVDGGRQATFSTYAAPHLSKLGALDLVCVSHIDSDHISGVLQLFDDLFAWRVYDFQQTTGNLEFPRPAVPRPPVVRAVWHNTFKDQVGENSRAIEDQLVASARVLNMDASVIGEELAQLAPEAGDVVTSVRESLQLASRLSAKQLRIPVNQEFGGQAIFLDQEPATFALGNLQLHLLGPFKADLEKQRADWNKWLADKSKLVDELRQEAEEDAARMPIAEGEMVLSFMRSLATALGQRNLVTPPNLASIMLLVQEGDKRLLLTGDGHADDICKGLALYENLLDSQGCLHVDVLKVQHHGAEFNIHRRFCETITADDYVFCGNGAHANPNLEVLQTLIDARLAMQSDPGNRPFRLWFSASSQTAATKTRQAHMRRVETLVRAATRNSGGRIKARFLTRNASFTLTV